MKQLPQKHSVYFAFLPQDLNIGFSCFALFGLYSEVFGLPDFQFL
jgi:hypothetical protein